MAEGPISGAAVAFVAATFHPGASPEVALACYSSGYQLLVQYTILASLPECYAYAHLAKQLASFATPHF